MNLLDVLAYKPFLEPMKVWNYWPLLLPPLCFAVSVVYKCVRVESVRRVPVEAFKAMLWIVGGMCATGFALWLLVLAFAR